MSQTIETLLIKHPLVSDQVSSKQVRVILAELEATLRQDVAGAIVEFGCYIGTTSLFIRRLLDEHCHSESFGFAQDKPRREIPSGRIEAGSLHAAAGLSRNDRQFHVYDSFEGLPEKTAADSSRAGDQFMAGELTVSKKQFIREFQKAHLETPVIHKGWFKDLTPADVPDKIAFAFLDGDFYESIRDSLRLVLPRMQKGGVIIVDDYAREALPGVARAVHERFQPDQIRTTHNLGIIHP